MLRCIKWLLTWFTEFASLNYNVNNQNVASGIYENEGKIYSANHRDSRKLKKIHLPIYLNVTAITHSFSFMGDKTMGLGTGYNFLWCILFHIELTLVLIGDKSNCQLLESSSTL